MNPKNFFFIGMPFTGKSFAAACLARDIKRKFIVIVHNVKDPTYRSLLVQAEVKYIAIKSPDVWVPETLFESIREDYRYLWLTVYDLNNEEIKSFLDSLIGACRYSGNLLLIIDEARTFCASRYVSDDFIGFVRGARRYGVDLALISHRYIDIDINIRCVFNILVLFRVVEPGDLEALRATPLGARVVDLPILPSMFHLFVNCDQGSATGPYKV